MANKTLKVNHEELSAILNELENELGDFLTTTNARLAKAREEDGTPSPGMGSASASATPSAGVSASPADSPAADGSAAGGEAPPSAGAPGEGAPPMEGAPGEGAPPADPSAGGAPAGAPGMDPSMGQDPAMDQGPVDPAALEAEYSKLPPEELKAHYLAAKAALFAVMGGGAGAGPEAAMGGAPGMGAPPAPSAAPAPSAPPPPSAGPAGAQPMAMSEMGKEVGKDLQAGNGGEGAPTPKPEATKKSEEDVASLHAQIETLAKAVNLLLTTPSQKAVTGITYVPKTEAAAENKVDASKLNKSEITSKLSEATRKPDLKKSDRDLINRYYEGEVRVDAIAHLLA